MVYDFCKHYFAHCHLHNRCLININFIQSIRFRWNFVWRSQRLEYVIWKILTFLCKGLNGLHFADDTVDENCCILIQISLKFVPNVMAWCRIDDKPLSKLMHICITQPRWVKTEQWERGQLLSDNKNIFYDTDKQIHLLIPDHFCEEELFCARQPI